MDQRGHHNLKMICSEWPTVVKLNAVFCLVCRAAVLNVYCMLVCMMACEFYLVEML